MSSGNQPRPKSRCGSTYSPPALHRLFHRFTDRNQGLSDLVSYLTSSEKAISVDSEVLRLKLIVHVIYSKLMNVISKEDVKSQIDRLNTDFSASNKEELDSVVPNVWRKLVIDSNIRFELDRIIYKSAIPYYFTKNSQDMKFTAKQGSNAIQPENYVNIWVCRLKDYDGYAQFPDQNSKRETDGIVIDYTCFGNQGENPQRNLGRTATHEMGHYLNLRHVFEPDVCVSDVPKSAKPNYDSPRFKHHAAANPPNGDMFMNYMDYVNDDTRVMFTIGQIAKMRATLRGFRKTLLT